MKEKQISIRVMREGDIPFAMELKNIAGWNQTEADWQRYMIIEPEGCFLVEVDGVKAGTGTAISYGSIGWIGMILVHPTQRRLGLGTEMLRKTITYLQNKGVACIKLDATPMGKQVYVPLGFKDEYEVQRYERKAGAIGSIAKETVDTDFVVSPVTDEVMGDIVAFDGEYFGVNRKLAFQELYRNSSKYALYIKDKSGIVGIIMAHEGLYALQIGPWIAKDVSIAEELFKAILGSSSGSSIFLDVPCPNVEGIKLMDKYGFTIQRGFFRMYLGENTYPGIPQEIYATSGPEKG